MNAAAVVFRKEWVDALRDRRTLAVVLLSSVAMGPLVLVLMSVLVGQLEERAQAREVLAVGIEHAPTLRNYLERQTFAVRPAGPNVEQRLADNRLGDPVIVVAAGFEVALRRGEAPVVELWSSSANPRAQAALGRVEALLRGFNQEQAMLRLAVRGVAPSVLEAVQVEPRDLADPAARATRLTAILPFFLLMALLYGALNAALDTTAGERERGSLEPLLMNPADPLALVIGKWAAVAAVAMLIALLSCLSLLPGRWLLRNEALAALFQYGPREALAFLALLLPLALALSGALMAVAVRCRTVKEAQASATVVVLAASLLPLFSIFNQEGEAAWHLWVPALAQATLMARVLKGQALPPGDLVLPLLVAVTLAALCLADLARTIRRAALA